MFLPSLGSIGSHQAQAEFKMNVPVKSWDHASNFQSSKSSHNCQWKNKFRGEARLPELANTPSNFHLPPLPREWFVTHSAILQVSWRLDHLIHFFFAPPTWMEVLMLIKLKQKILGFTSDLLNYNLQWWGLGFSIKSVMWRLYTYRLKQLHYC